MTEQNRTEQPHAIMFHHFFDNKHVKGQGAISSHQFENIIESHYDDLLPAKEWFDKAKTNSLGNYDICLSFDDTLLCQYEVALPVLEKYNLTAFWFVYSSVLDGGIEFLEIYRKFRTEYFNCIDDFYDSFFSVVNKSQYCDNVALSLRSYSHDKWKHFPFYSRNDTKFRYIRDTSLSTDQYNHIMTMMMQNYKIDLNEFASDLWMDAEHIKRLHSNGHIIGLHSHTHPKKISKLSVPEQENEYQTNYNFLYDVLGERPITMAHPSNSYNEQTLSILEKLGIELGFRANMEDHNYSKFEFPREDHANIIRKI